MKQETQEVEQVRPVIKRSRSLSKVWVIPILGLFLGLWLVKRSHDDKGRLVVVTFESADGLADNKSEVRCRNVKIGKVESITLDDQDLTVMVNLRIKKQHVGLVREGSKFWVVKPRVSGTGISGLGTILSGSYIELDPGPVGEEKTIFVGEEQPPPTPASVPGLRLNLFTQDPGSVDVGSGVYFSGNQVGKVESRTFDSQKLFTRFGIFIEDEFAHLVKNESLFWRDSGLELSVGAEGFQVDFPSLESLISGRIHFNSLVEYETDALGKPASTYELFAGKQDAEDSSFRSAADLVLLLEQSVRGLAEGAPVEFRGLRVGRVGKISYQLLTDASVEQTPVLIQLDANLLAKHFPPVYRDEGEGGLQDALNKGLRASLKTSSLITGQLYVDLDFYPDLGPIAMKKMGDYVVFPTIETGLNQLEDKVAALLDKFNGLELEKLIVSVNQTSEKATTALENVNSILVDEDGVIAEAQGTLLEMTKTMKSLDRILKSDETQAIPADIRKTLAAMNESLEPLSNDGVIYGDLRRTLDELRATIRSVERMTTEIADKPNSLIFGKTPSSRKIPRARKK